MQTHQQINQIAMDIFNLLLPYANYLNEFSKISEINGVHLKKIKSYVEMNKEVLFIIPAFPAKSRNRKKTLSSSPDYGELEALRRLNSMCLKIKDIYDIGAKVLVCSDGRVFSDLVGVTEEDVTLYSRELRQIKENYELDYIDYFNLEDVFTESLNFSQMREQLAAEYGASLESVKERVKTEDDMRNMFNGIHRFVKEDYFEIKKDMTRNQINKMSKEVAYKVILMSNAWSGLVEKKFPEAIRLSIHPQHSSSYKFPVKLLPGGGSWGTPWHRVPVVQGDNVALLKHEEALEKGAMLKKYDDKYSFFELKGDLL